MTTTTTDEQQALAEALEGTDWRNLEWRLDNLYWIVDKDSKGVRFSMNPEQRDFVRNIRPRNIILKARQKGFSTLLQILELDQALFNTNHNGVVIADTLPNAGKLFKKVEFALERLSAPLREALPIKSRTDKSSLEFAHGSSIYVSTSARGGTVQLLHVSELGKIARKHPEKAQEIVTGAFEAVPASGCIVVESTAEGAAGEFYDLVMPALRRMEEGAPETDLDWRLHFYPWYASEEYRLDPAGVHISAEDHKFFNAHQAKLGIKLDDWQRAWYVKKKETLKRLMKREYPTTPQEAFEVAVEGAVYGEEMTYLRERGRIGAVPLDPTRRVNTFWDFGLRDKNAIWFHQQIGMQHRWFKYHHESGRSLTWWWKYCEDLREEHGFRWGRHYLPHDADAEILGENITTKHRDLVKLGMRNTIVVARVANIDTGIEITRNKLVGNHWFDREGCAEGIKCLDGYQFEWNDKLAVWSTVPLHNWASHGADAWRQFAQGYREGVPEEERDHDDDRRKRDRNWKTR
jgi:hypothetical protein